MVKKSSSEAWARPDILIEFTEDQVKMLGLPENSLYVIASASMGYGFSATLANVRGFGAIGKEFLLDVAASLDLESKHVVIRTVKGIVIYESCPERNRLE